MIRTNSVGAALHTPRGWVESLRFDDVLEFTEHVHPWGLDFTQVRRGPFHSSGFLLSLGSVTVASASINQAMVHRVTVPCGQFSVFTIGPASDSGFLGAQSLRIGDCISVPGATRFETVTRGDFTGLGLSFDEDAWYGSAQWLGPLPAEAPRGLRIDDYGERWGERLYALTHMALEVAEDAALTRDGTAIRSSLAESLLIHVRNGHTNDTQESTEHRARARRRAAVQRAREFIDARLSEPIRLEQVCRYACAQSRTLEYGFREMFDTPMVSYIKALRMDRVRKLLRCPAQRHRTVSELALDSGFCHLSQFASDYKKFFGESPSQTHRRACGLPARRLPVATARGAGPPDRQRLAIY